MKSELMTVLHQRGFINQCTDLATLDDEASRTKITAYIGFDLTADSLHVGSLIQIMVLRWMQKLGHNPIALLGGFTTRIGDPTGRSSARPMLTEDQVALNWTGIRSVLNRLIPNVMLVDNSEWLFGMSISEFFISFGQHVSINRMLGIDTVKNRLAQGDNLSLLEFSYSVMQGLDFVHLYGNRNCALQIGGSDQWANILAGTDLIRRRDGHAYGLTTPLMTNTAGEKMGKTAGGTVWLSPQKTNAFDFWQFWRNVEDEKVEEFLKLFTELPLDVIDHLMGVNGPGINAAKRSLATEVTTLVHGEEAALAAQSAADGSVEGLPRHEVRGGQTVGEVLLDIAFVKSKGEADRLAAQNGLRIDGELVTDARAPFPQGEHVVVQGKKKRALVVGG